MKNVRLVLIGVGGIGTMHLTYLMNNEVTGCEIVGVCDTNPEKLAIVKNKYGEALKYYANPSEVMADESVEAVMIATPHYDHPLIAVEAIKANKHVLIEKPIGVYTKNIIELNELIEKNPQLTCGIMYNQRTNPFYQKVRELVANGEIGELRRTNWIITDWYRSQSYYNSSNWRATWKGEGGGVLLNQDPHQLDLWQWICGMPSRVHSFAYFGKRRDVEVETDVTAYVEYPNGANGVFVTTTTETPGTNRFEIVGSLGKLVIENQQLRFWRSTVDEAEFNETFKGGFGSPETWEVLIPIKFDEDSQHKKITQNFINNILNGEELLAPAVEGIRGLTISNAIHLSAWKGEWVDLPLDPNEFYEELQKRVATSKMKEGKDVVLDTDSTY